jgi:hypothetical protein
LKNLAELGIAHVGLADTDVRRLKSMMASAIGDCTLVARWCLAKLETAHLVIGSPEAAAGIVADCAAERNPEQVVAVLAGESDAEVEGTEKLPWPIRIEHLLALLRTVERRVLKVSVMPEADASHPLVRLAALLRHAEGPADLCWRIVGLGRAPIYIAPAHRQYFCAESLRTLNRFENGGRLDFMPVPPRDLPTEFTQPKPIAMLQWSVGLLTGPLGILPWLEASSGWRLRRFPEFQILHHEPAHRRLAAAFSRPAQSISAVADWTQIAPEAVVGFVNGAELCGYLHAEELAAEASSLGPDASRQGLAHILRRALGIVENAAHG